MLVGLVGKPSVGKSTFFKAATLADVAIASYPFTTIKPNHAIAYVRIKDLAVEFEKHSNPREGFVKGDWRFVPFELADVAGLVEGASEGKGLGNQFLDDLTNADALIMVVDMSGETDAEGKAIDGDSHDPCEDIRMIETELDKWYLGIFQKVWKTVARNMEVQKIDFAEGVAKQFSGLKVTEDDVKAVVLEKQIDISRVATWNDDELLAFAKALRKHTKPIVIAGNKMDRPRAREHFENVKNTFTYPCIACFADGELALREADKAGLVAYTPGENTFETKETVSEKQREALDSIATTMNSFGSTGVQAVLNTVIFNLLNYVAVYPAGSKLEDSKGNVLPDCYLMPPGSTVLDFAFRLHTDIGNNFVKAVDVRTGKAVGKDHVIQSGDGYEILTR